jgi:hypothetical protein
VVGVSVIQESWIVKTKGDVVGRQGQGRAVQVMSKFKQVVVTRSAAGSPRPSKSLGHDESGFSIFG